MKMLAKTILVVFFVALAVSLAQANIEGTTKVEEKDDEKEESMDDKIIESSTLTTVGKHIYGDIGKYVTDLKILVATADKAKTLASLNNFLDTKFKDGVESIHKNINLANVLVENQLKKEAENCKTSNPKLYPLLVEHYNLKVALDRKSEDILKRMMNAENIKNKYKTTKTDIVNKLSNAKGFVSNMATGLASKVTQQAGAAAKLLPGSGGTKVSASSATPQK